MTLEPEQRTAARLAGFLFILFMCSSLFGELYLRGPRLVPNDAAQTAHNIVAAERLFRLNIALRLLTSLGNVVLLWALYVVLRPVNRNLALLGAFWRLGECVMFGVVALNEILVLRFLLGDAPYMRAFTAEQLQALARVFLLLHHPGGEIAGIFYALGSTVFAWLWFQSRYIPRVLSALGILASAVLGSVLLINMVYPSFESSMGVAYWLPIAVFELVLGFWLLIRGIRVPQQA